MAHILASAALRQSVIDEAQSWIGTPFHHAARIKGAGVDCGYFLAEVYERAGVAESMNFPHYPVDWFKHSDFEMYLSELQQRCDEISDPRPGDIALFKVGRAFAHGAVIVDWPTKVIHAAHREGVAQVDATTHPLLSGREVRFYRPFSLA